MTASRDVGSVRPLLDKLGVWPGMRIGLADFADEAFAVSLAGRGVRVEELTAHGEIEPESLDLLFFLARRPADLARIGALRPLIRDTGAIWVLREKGARRSIREVDVIEAARTFGLVDNKIASFSEALAAMRLVVPVAMRKTERGIRGRSR